MGVKEFMQRRSLKARDDKRTRAAELTLRESLYPICLVTILFFLWGFSYGTYLESYDMRQELAIRDDKEEPANSL